MQIYRCLSMIAFIAILALIIGCSGGKSPVTPDNTTDSLDTIPIIGLSETGDTFNAIGLMGAYDLTINPDEMTADLVSKRFSAIGEDYIVSGIGFFTITPCAKCLYINSISLAGGNLVLNFGIEHPFDKGIVGLPPTASNRLDLNVFDLAMVIAPNETATTYSAMGVDVNIGVLAEPDGYTRELETVISNVSAMPYVLVIDESEEVAHMYNMFEMGASSTFDVAFLLTMGTTLRFDTYLTMGYGASAKRPTRLDPKYCNPEFNRKAAWKVEAQALGEWTDTDNTSTVDVDVKIYDWQTGATVYGTPDDFANAPADNIYAASEVASVSVDIPGMNSTPPSVTSATSGTGMPTDPIIFIVPVANANLIADGTYTGLVKVLDERACLTVPDGRDIIIDSPDGASLNYETMPEYATYQTFTATVLVGNLPPVADAVATTPSIILEGMPVTFDATGSYDPDGTVDLYEWDFDEDGNFAESPDDDYIGDPWNPTHYFDYGDGLITVQLRVTDNLGATDELDSPTTIDVNHSKNINVTNSGGEPRDICIDHTTGDVLILYDQPPVGGEYRGEVKRFRYSTGYSG